MLLWTCSITLLYSSTIIMAFGSVAIAKSISGVAYTGLPTDFDALIKMGFGTSNPKSWIGFISGSVWPPFFDIFTQDGGRI
jgi:hypothetical protein